MPDEVDETALARELGAEPAEPPKTPPPSETPPKGEETPKQPDATEGAQPPAGEKKDGKEEPKGETPPDPLEGLDLKDILAHPVLGPKFNQWADTAAKHQVEAATQGAKDTVKAEEERSLIEKEDKYFSTITPEQLKIDLNDEETGAKAAAAYGRFQLRKEQAANAPKAPTPEETDFNVKVAATRSLVATYREMVDGSDLPDEVKAKLQPENYKQYGAEALPRWGKDIYEALVQLKHDTEWESVKETRLAELDKDRPGSGGGRPPGAMPDLMETPSEVGLEQAIAAEAQKKK